MHHLFGADLTASQYHEDQPADCVEHEAHSAKQGIDLSGHLEVVQVLEGKCSYLAIQKWTHLIVSQLLGTRRIGPAASLSKFNLINKLLTVWQNAAEGKTYKSSCRVAQVEN